MKTNFFKGLVAIFMGIFLSGSVFGNVSVSAITNQYQAIGYEQNAANTTFKVNWDGNPPNSFAITIGDFQYNGSANDWSSRVSVDPTMGSFDTNNPGPTEITVTYTMTANASKGVDTAIPGTYTYQIYLNGSSMGTFTIKIVDPTIDVWQDSPNMDMVFDRPRTVVSTRTNGNPPVIEVFGAWKGAGAPYQLKPFPGNMMFAPNPEIARFRLYNGGYGGRGAGTVEYKIDSVTYAETPPFEWIWKINNGNDDVLWKNGEPRPDSDYHYTIKDEVEAPGANFTTIQIMCATSSQGGFGLETLDVGTYVATVTISARSTDTQAIALNSPLQFLVVLRVGTKVELVDPMLYPNSDSVVEGKGLLIGAVAEYAGREPLPKKVLLSYSSANRFNERPTHCPDTTGVPPRYDYPNGDNPNKLRYNLTKWGDLDGKWFTVTVSSRSETPAIPSEFTEEEGEIQIPNDMDCIRISYHTQDLYPGSYRGYIFVHANDGFGKECANNVFTFDPNNPNSLPTWGSDPLNDGNVITVNLRVVGPTIGLSTNAISEIIETRKQWDSQPFYIWNRYADWGHLHYNYTITGDNGINTDWLTLSITKYDGSPNPEQIVGPYDDPDEPGLDNRDIITLHYDTTGLSPGIYGATITFYGDKDPDGNEICENSPQYVHVNVKVVGPYIATNVAELHPICKVGTNADNDNSFTIWNADTVYIAEHPGSILNYSITTDQNWLNCDPVEGDSTGRWDKDTINVSYTTSDLSPGTYTGNITITNELTGDTRVIKVTLTVTAPVIALSTKEILRSCEYGDTPDTASFEVWNADTSGSTLEYELSTDVDWLKLTDAKGKPQISTGPADRRTIYVSFNVQGLSAGKYTGTITVSSETATKSNETITVELEIKGSTVTVEPLTLYPTCAVGNDAAPQTFQVWNGSGFSILNFTISTEYIEDTGGIEWLSVSPSSGSSEDATDKQIVTVTYDTDKLSTGTYTANITISDPNSSNVSETVKVVLVVQDPVLKLSESEITDVISVGTLYLEKAFKVWNAGGGILYYTVEDDQPWLRCYDTNGENPNGSSSGEKDTITISINSRSLTTGTYTATITVKGYKDAAHTQPITPPAEQTIKVILKVGAVVEVSTKEPITLQCYEGETPDNTSFKVRNGGDTNSTLAYTISDDATWLSCSPTSGTSTGDWHTISVDLNGISSLSAGTYTATITVQNSNVPSDKQTITVNLTVLSGAIIALSQTSLNVEVAEGGNADPDTFQIYNSGKGTLNYTVTDDATWLECTPTTGDSIGLADKDTITVNYSTASLAKGIYSATITITDPLAENSPQTISVSLKVLGSTIATDKDSLSLSSDVDETATETFQIWNSGGGTLNYTITASTSDGGSWLSVNPTSGTSSGEKDTITVTCNGAGLNAGTYTGTITIQDPNATVTSETISVNYYVGIPQIALNTTSLSPSCTEGTNADTQTFQVYNSGAGTLSYTISDDVDWLSCSPASGSSTGPEDVDTISVVYATDTLSPGTYNATITVSAPKASNDPQTISVTLTVNEALPQAQLLVHLTNSRDGITRDADNDVSFWPDQTSNHNSAGQVNKNKQPVYVQNLLDTNMSLAFNGKAALEIPSANGINQAGPFSGKTVALAFRTGSDVDTRQVIFSQGSKSGSGLAIYLDQGSLYMTAWSQKQSIWNASISTSVTANTAYSAIMIINKDSDILKGYINGSEFASANGVGYLYDDKYSIVLGNRTGGNILFHDGKSSRVKGFIGNIAKFIYYNSALTSDTEISSLETNLAASYNNLNFAGWFRGDSGITRDYDDTVTKWVDKAHVANKLFYFKQNSRTRRPVYKNDAGASQAGIAFDGENTFMMAKSSKIINSDVSYGERTIFIVFKPAIVSPTQILWAEGDKKAGLNVYIESGSIHAAAWNTTSKKGTTAWGQALVSGGTLTADTVYCVQVTLDDTSLKVYLNGSLIGSDSADDIAKHAPAVIGAIKRGTYIDNTWQKKGAYYNGNIMEIQIYSSALSASEVSSVESYFNSRYSIVFE